MSDETHFYSCEQHSKNGSYMTVLNWYELKMDDWVKCAEVHIFSNIFSWLVSRPKDENMNIPETFVEE